MSHSHSILVVDDTAANLKLLVDVLTKAGHVVRPADSGELALASVAADPPALILLDIRMPGMGGFEVFRRLREQPVSRRVPVIFISASSNEEQRIEGLKMGAVDYVTKPFRSEELLARVGTHLELRRLQVELERRLAELGTANEALTAEIEERKRTEAEKERLIEKLHEALADIETLRGIIPICASCKMVRDDQGFWSQVEQYISDHSLAKFSHGLCPECLAQYYPDIVPKP